MRFTGRSRFFSYLALPLVVTAGIALVLFVTSCSGRSPVQDEQDRLFVSRENGLSFTCPDDWVVVKEISRNGITTLQLDKQNDQDVKLIVTILPAALSRDELVQKAKQLLESSLYYVQTVHEVEEKEISGRCVIFLDAAAGEKEVVLTRTAVFADEERSYLLTLMAEEGTFSTMTAEFEHVVTGMFY